ncbi:MAG TPA: DUF4232 domain-containing protein [Streptosporangiaceae bacterium]|nr:DUF4232 domain-containing protein [Streptosporangiaceae bacterium]
MQLFNRPGMRVRVLVIAAAALACSAAALLPTIAQARQASPQVARCSASNTDVWFAISPSGAAGTIYYPVEFTNLGSHTCWLSGYPRVFGTTKSGTSFGAAAGRLTMPVRRIVLRKNQTAHALLGIVEPGIIPGCHAVTGGGLAVYPPGQAHKQLVGSFYFPGCRNKKAVYLHVGPVQAGIGVP